MTNLLKTLLLPPKPKHRPNPIIIERHQTRFNEQANTTAIIALLISILASISILGTISNYNTSRIGKTLHAIACHELNDSNQGFDECVADE